MYFFFIFTFTNEKLFELPCDDGGRKYVFFVFSPKNAAKYLRSNNDVIDGNVNKFHEETNETHNAETNSCGNCNLLKFLTIGFCATFDESN